MCIICTESVLRKEIMWSEREKSFTLGWQGTIAAIAEPELCWKVRPSPPQFMCCYCREREDKPSPNFSIRKIMKKKERWFTGSDLETHGVCWQQPREAAELVSWFSNAERRLLTLALQNHRAPAFSALQEEERPPREASHPSGPPAAWTQCSANQPQVPVLTWARGNIPVKS